MNRAQRRMVERSARQTAQRRIERPATIPMFFKADLVMRPIEQIIDQIETYGTVDASGDVPVFRPVDEHEWYPAGPALDGVADAFDMWAHRHQKVVNTAPLRVLARALSAGADVTQTNLADLNALMPRLRAIACRFGDDEAKDFIPQTQIKAELEATHAP